MIVFKADELIPVGYTDFDFQSDRDNSKSTSGFCVYFRRWSHNYGGVLSIDTFLDSTIEAEYVAASEAATEVIWLRNFMMDLDMIFGLPKNY